MINLGIIGLGVGVYHLRGTKDIENVRVTCLTKFEYVVASPTFSPN